MSDHSINNPMLEMFLFETSQLIEQLEVIILAGEKESCFTQAAINEIFRIMHTIKGSSAMMLYNSISNLAHSIEDVFYFLRDEKPSLVDCSLLSDLVLEGVDFIKVEMEKIRSGDFADGNADGLVQSIEKFLEKLKRDNLTEEASSVIINDNEKVQEYYIPPASSEPFPYNHAYKAVIFFEEGCEMENIRAYTIIHNLKERTNDCFYYPDDIIDDDESAEIIRQKGFHIVFRTNDTYEEIQEFLNRTIFLKELKLDELTNEDDISTFRKEILATAKDEFDQNTEADTIDEKEDAGRDVPITSMQSSIISVSVAKLDMLMDLVGEMVIAEAMVVQNPDLQGMVLNNFDKAARQLNKITSDIQDMVMSIRMVPLSATFQKMHRVVRDMSKKLSKDIKLEIIGEETEVDKNIIEQISDPLMHLVRNAIDHGIEEAEERILNGKSLTGHVALEAKNEGSDVFISVRDDGRGLDKDKILQKARENSMLYKHENEMSDREIYNLILLPGFSTSDEVTEFSGRGVGMDVVMNNIESVGGTISVDSTAGKGMSVTIKIPLTLAIIDGMNIKVGNSSYTVPTISIKESFRAKDNDIITDPDGNEMIMVRGNCHKILRLHEVYKVKTKVTELTDGIIIMVEKDENVLCIFADELINQQQVVVKSLPSYIQKFRKIEGLSGCTLLGDGSISLIIDVAGLMNI